MKIDWTKVKEGFTTTDLIKVENKELKEENERLKIIEEKYKDSQLYIKDFKDEIERLNNIINDFEEELEREVNIKEEDTGLEHNTYIDIRNTLKTVLKRFRELKGSEKE